MHGSERDRDARPARELIAYFALAYGISWGAILAYLATVGFDLAAFGAGQRMVFLTLMVAGPFAAGLTLTAAFEGRRGLAGLYARFLRLRVGVRWYAFALLPVPILLVAILLPLTVLVSPDYTPTFYAFGIVAGLVAGVFEETGWTGFATPRLLERYSPIRAGLLLGLIWAAWHGLADYVGNVETMGVADWAVRMVVYWMVPLTCYRVLMTWAYAHHESLGLATLMHAGYTGWLVTFTMEMPAATGPNALLWEGLFAAAIVVLTTVVVRSTRARVAPMVSRPAI